jgi:hypothetical protein
MLSAISSFVELQTACIHAYAVRIAHHHPTSHGTRLNLIEAFSNAPVMSSQQIITLVSKGLGSYKANQEALTSKKEMPAVGIDGRNTAISGSLTAFNQFVQVSVRQFCHRMILTTTK